MAPYEIVHAGGTTTVAVNQTEKGGRWNVLGVHPFNAGGGGSVTLRNTATGTISADAVRFVRISDIPSPVDPGYIVGSVLYQTGFETNVSADFAVSQQVAGDNAANFSFDYSTFAQAAAGNPAYIPLSPGSSGAGSHALRVDENIANGVANGITATLTAISGQSNFRIRFDAWQNYNGAWAGGTGSTEFATFGASADSARVAMGASSYATAGSAFSGFFFGIAGEGGASDDYRYYDGNGAAATGANGARANFLGTSATNHTVFKNVFYPVSLYETPGGPGKAWNRWEVAVLNGKVRLSVIKPDGMEVVLCNWFTPNASATLTGLLPHFGTMDPNAGSASPASDNFVLYDNIVVESISSTSVVGDWSAYQ